MKSDALSRHTTWVARIHWFQTVWCPTVLWMLLMYDPGFQNCTDQNISHLLTSHSPFILTPSPTPIYKLQFDQSRKITKLEHLVKFWNMFAPPPFLFLLHLLLFWTAKGNSIVQWSSQKRQNHSGKGNRSRISFKTYISAPTDGTVQAMGPSFHLY